MKKFVYTLLALTIGFTSCSKWTETESKAEEFENAALKDLREKRDNAKWLAEAERTVENKRALEAIGLNLLNINKKLGLIPELLEVKCLWCISGMTDLLGNL